MSTRGASTICGVCQCLFCDSDCVAATNNPTKFSSIVDDNSTNLYECGPTGQAVFLPPYILDPPACHAYGTVPQPMGNDTAQNVILNEERYDTDSMHDKENLEHSDRITFNTAGVYLVTFNCTWDNNSSGDRAAFIQLNGAQFLALESKHAGDADLLVGHSMSVEHEFEVEDYVTAIVKQDSGASLSIEVTRYSPIFTACFLRPPTTVITGS